MKSLSDIESRATETVEAILDTRIRELSRFGKLIDSHSEMRDFIAFVLRSSDIIGISRVQLSRLYSDDFYEPILTSSFLMIQLLKTQLDIAIQTLSIHPLKVSKQTQFDFPGIPSTRHQLQQQPNIGFDSLNFCSPVSSKMADLASNQTTASSTQLQPRPALVDFAGYPKNATPKDITEFHRFLDQFQKLADKHMIQTLIDFHKNSKDFKSRNYLFKMFVEDEKPEDSASPAVEKLSYNERYVEKEVREAMEVLKEEGIGALDRFRNPLVLLRVNEELLREFQGTQIENGREIVKALKKLNGIKFNEQAQKVIADTIKSFVCMDDPSLKMPLQPKSIEEFKKTNMNDIESELQEKLVERLKKSFYSLVDGITSLNKKVKVDIGVNTGDDIGKGRWSSSGDYPQAVLKFEQIVRDKDEQIESLKAEIRRMRRNFEEANGITSNVNDRTSNDRERPLNEVQVKEKLSKEQTAVRRGYEKSLEALKKLSALSLLISRDVGGLEQRFNQQSTQKDSKSFVLSDFVGTDFRVLKAKADKSKEIAADIAKLFNLPQAEIEMLGNFFTREIEADISDDSAEQSDEERESKKNGKTSFKMKRKSHQVIAGPIESARKKVAGQEDVKGAFEELEDRSSGFLKKMNGRTKKQKAKVSRKSQIVVPLKNDLSSAHKTNKGERTVKPVGHFGTDKERMSGIPKRFNEGTVPPNKPSSHPAQAPDNLERSLSQKNESSDQQIQNGKHAPNSNWSKVARQLKASKPFLTAAEHQPKKDHNIHFTYNFTFSNKTALPNTTHVHASESAKNSHKKTNRSHDSLDSSNIAQGPNSEPKMTLSQLHGMRIKLKKEVNWVQADVPQAETVPVEEAEVKTELQQAESQQTIEVIRETFGESFQKMPSITVPWKEEPRNRVQETIDYLKLVDYNTVKKLYGVILDLLVQKDPKYETKFEEPVIREETESKQLHLSPEPLKIVPTRVTPLFKRIEGTSAWSPMRITSKAKSVAKIERTDQKHRTAILSPASKAALNFSKMRKLKNDYMLKLSRKRVDLTMLGNCLETKNFGLRGSATPASRLVPVQTDEKENLLSVKAEPLSLVGAPIAPVGRRIDKLGNARRQLRLNETTTAIKQELLNSKKYSSEDLKLQVLSSLNPNCTQIEEQQRLKFSIFLDKVSQKLIINEDAFGEKVNRFLEDQNVKVGAVGTRMHSIVNTFISKHMHCQPDCPHLSVLLSRLQNVKRERMTEQVTTFGYFI